MPQISVIVPVYNVEQYLHRCVDSILGQTYTDFELILVDDGSPDRCPEICDEYAAKDTRVRVIHKPNGGVSSARNAGLDVATGVFVTFVDSDDWVVPIFVEELLRTPADLVCQTVAIIQELSGDEHRHHLISVQYDGRTKDELCELLLKGSFNLAICKRFRNDIIKQQGIRFHSEVNFGEDTLFTMDYAIHAKSVVVEDVANYRYVIYQSRETLSNSYSDDRMLMIKKANHLICHSVAGSDAELENSLFLKRMMNPYCEYIRRNLYDASGYLKFFGILGWLKLKNDRDFLSVLHESNIHNLPDAMGQAIRSMSSARVVFVHYYLFARQCLGRIRRKLKS